MSRRIIRMDGDVISVAVEDRFESELQLQNAITAHPEVLPVEDIGTDQLAVLASQLDLGSGPMDLLAADAHGRIAIVEFKKGTENRTVREVIAQMLHYGSALWRTEYGDLERRCRTGIDPNTLEEKVRSQLGDDEQFDPEEFEQGVAETLKDGNFVFLYVVRDLDQATREVMTYLAEGAKMYFIAIEVDYFHDSAGSSVLVPRTAFVPSWIAGPGVDRKPQPNPEAVALIRLLDEEIVPRFHLLPTVTRRGVNYGPPNKEPGPKHVTGIGVYYSSRGVEVNLSVFRDLGRDDLADKLWQALVDISGKSLQSSKLWPVVRCNVFTENWARARDEIIPYFHARQLLWEAQASGEAGGLPLG